MKNLILTLVVAVLVPVGFALLGGTRALGAHIWWDVQTILIGAPIGLVLGFGASWLPYRRTKGIFAFLILLALSFAIAKYGQITFANSYGEDAFAGAAWYFGWIATGAFTSATLFTALRR
ncbi:hypothetical protein [Neptunicoccus cionae]|uniref:Uncharacterized protein n=1 Tax=Neptunicoccus cionae TaxID=2035344 RepID=A0A916QQ99_9RHOB|nr:hypothetical protein [Amylibacter cionae]GGA05291.1 hypothetical protein GCM10011498_01080 [Amylibacter cionae]